MLELPIPFLKAGFDVVVVVLVVKPNPLSVVVANKKAMIRIILYSFIS